MGKGNTVLQKLFQEFSTDMGGIQVGPSVNMGIGIYCYMEELNKQIYLQYTTSYI